MSLLHLAAQAPCCPQDRQCCVPETGERSFHLQCPFYLSKVLLWPLRLGSGLALPSPPVHSCRSLQPSPRAPWASRPAGARANGDSHKCSLTILVTLEGRRVTAQRRKQAARSPVGSAHLALGWGWQQTLTCGLHSGPSNRFNPFSFTACPPSLEGRSGFLIRVSASGCSARQDRWQEASTERHPERDPAQAPTCTQEQTING